jgi:hypothetical protein
MGLRERFPEISHYANAAIADTQNADFVAFTMTTLMQLARVCKIQDQGIYDGWASNALDWIETSHASTGMTSQMALFKSLYYALASFQQMPQSELAQKIIAMEITRPADGVDRNKWGFFQAQFFSVKWQALTHVIRGNLFVEEILEQAVAEIDSATNENLDVILGVCEPLLASSTFNPSLAVTSLQSKPKIRFP